MKPEDYADPEIKREMQRIADVFLRLKEKDARKKRVRAFRYADPLLRPGIHYKAPKRIAKPKPI
jgi:hypothetical protein